MPSLVSTPGLGQPGALRPGFPGLPGIAPPGPPVVTICGQAAQSVPYQSSQPPAAWRSLQVPVTNTIGHWMAAIVTWRQQTAGEGATVHVGDDTMRNFWQPLGQPTGTSSAAGVVRTAIWTAPAAYAAQYVCVSPTAAVQAIGCTVLDVSGMLPWQTLTTLNTTYANAATSLFALTTGTPASSALVITGCGTDLNTATVSVAGTGWTTITPVASSNGTDHTADITLSGAYQLTTGTTSASWSSTATEDMCGIIAGILVSGTPPVQASPHWPYTVAEIALNAGPSTPADQLTWTPVTARALQMQSVTQGAQYNLAALNSGTGTVILDNPDGQLIPPGSGTYAGIDSGTPFRVRQILPAAINPYGVPFAGNILNWSQEWPDPMYRGQATVTITDAWAYCNGNLQPILLQEILNDNPYAYWPCIDAAGTVQASNYGAGNGTPLAIQQAKNGSVGVSNGFGQNNTALLGAQGTYLLTSSVRSQTQAGMWGLAGTSNGSPPEGYSLTAADTSFPPVSGGVTIELFFQTTSPYSAVGQSVWMIGGVAQPILQIFMFNNGSGGTLGYQYVGSLAGISTIQGASTTNYCNGQLVHLAFSFSQTAWTSYIDGVQAGTGTFSPALPAHFDTLTVNGICGTTSPQGAFSVFDSMNFNGYAGHVAVFAGQLHPERIMTHYQAGVLGMTGDTPDARIERLLQAGNYPGRRVILQEPAVYAPPCASCQDIASQPAATSITNIAQSTVPAVLAIAPTGDITYLDRSYVWNQSPRWTLGNNTAAGEIPFLPTFAAGYDPLRVVNDVQLTQLDNQDIVTPQPPVAALDATSQQQYGDQAWWVTGYLENDLLSPYSAGPGLIELVNWIGNVSARPGLRVTAITVEAATNTLGWPLFMTAAKGDMVTVNARPVTDPGLVLSITGRVSQTTRNLQWSQDGCHGTIDLLIDIAPEENVLTADDPVRGQLTGAYPLAW